MNKAERQASLVRMRAAKEEANKIVSTGVCPECGAKLRSNTSLTGWWQCGRFGRDSFRLPEYRGQKDCGFQCFTD